MNAKRQWELLCQTQEYLLQVENNFLELDLGYDFSEAIEYLLSYVEFKLGKVTHED